jgi:hypothetical protein
MRLRDFPFAAVAFYIGLSISIAPAQQQQQQTPPQQTQHEDLKLRTMPQKGGKEEPSSQIPTNSNAVFVDGKLNVPGAPEDSQTVPAKFSKRNNSIDKLPIMAMPLALTDEQKHRIADSVAKEPEQQISAKPADMLPADTPVVELPKEVADIPAVNALKAIPTHDKVLLVNPTNMVVVAEIAK